MSVSFRPFSNADLAGYQRWFDDAEVARRMAYPSPEWMDYIKTPDVLCFVASEGSEKSAAVLQMDIDPNGCGHLSLVVHPDLRHAGVGARVLTAFVMGPGQNMDELCASIDPDNAASLAIAKRAGFVVENACDKDGLVSLIRPANAA